MPWRFAPGREDPYRTWVSEVMLQQTRVEAVVPYYGRFVERWPTLRSLAQAREEDVLAAWSGLGYYARGRNLWRAAREALRRHGGLPSSARELRELPGFGPYTAGAVASIAFGEAVPAVDGNAARVLARILAVRRDGPPARRTLEAFAATLVDRERPGAWNQALMELGATVCLPRRPRCHLCPLAPRCVARERGLTAAIPARRRRAPRRRLLLALARVERDGRVLLERRPGAGLFAGLWQLPGAEIGVGESPGPALGRVLARRLGAPARVGPEVGRVERELTHRVLEMRVFRCDIASDPCPGRRGRLRWAGPGEVSRLGLPTAMREAMHASEGWDGEGPGAEAGGGVAGRGKSEARRGRGPLTSRASTV